MREPLFPCKVRGKKGAYIRAPAVFTDKRRATFVHERQRAIMYIITNVH